MPINQATQIAKQNHSENKNTIWKLLQFYEMKYYHLKAHR